MQFTTTMPFKFIFSPLPVATILICSVGFYLSLLSKPFSTASTAQGISKPTVKPSRISEEVSLNQVYSSAVISPTPELLVSSPIPTPVSVSNPTLSSPTASKPSPIVKNSSVTPPPTTKSVTTPISRTAQLFTQGSQQPSVVLTPSQLADWKQLTSIPQAVWLGGWIPNIKDFVSSYTNAAKATNTIPVIVLYNIPFRDCGNYSAGGSNDPAAYREWIQEVVAGGKGSGALVIVEPDSLALTACLTPSQLTDRYDLLRSTVKELSSNGMKPYLDAGHSSWVSTEEMASKLQKAGVSQASGFSLNISNFQKTIDEVAYGTSLSSKLAGKHFVIDTSRNGNGAPSDFSWCNPFGRKLGEKPTLQTNTPLVDAFLWIKHPGESDGECNGGPSAGQWWPEYARSLL